VNGGVEVTVEGGRVVTLAAHPPVAAKVLPGPILLLVGSSAGLLEGDTVTVDLVLGPGAHLTVRSTAATLAHPCRGGGVTRFDVRASLGEGATLAWLPEPLVACAGCHHVGRSSLSLAAGAVAVWSEACTLGRSGEEPGQLEIRLDAEHDGRPLLRDGLRVGPATVGWRGPAGLGGARHVGSVHLLGRRPSHPVPDALGLAGPGATVRAVAADGASLEARLDLVRRLFLADLPKEQLSHV
jgi:urease accessory protein